jgi:hypothetical protein
VQPTLRLLSISPSFLPHLDTVSVRRPQDVELNKWRDMEVLCTARTALRSIKGVNFSVCNWDSKLPLVCVGLTNLSLVFDCLRDSAWLVRNALVKACPALRQLELFVGHFSTMLYDFFADPHPNRIEALTIQYAGTQMCLTQQPWLQNLLRGFPVLTSVTFAPAVRLDDAYFLLALAPRIRHLEGLDITSLAWPDVLFPELESVHECEFQGVELSTLLSSAPALHTLWSVALGENITGSLGQRQPYGKALRTLGLRKQDTHRRPMAAQLRSFCDDVALVADDRASLRTLQLVGVIETMNVARSVMSSVSATIEDLRIQRCPGFTEELLNEWLPACSNLVSIRLDVLTSDQFSFQVFTSLSRLQSVKVHLVGSTVTPTDIDALPGNLTRLCVSGARIVDPAAVIQVLAQKSPKLLHLRLDVFNNRDPAVLATATSLRYLQSLEGM